MLRSRSGPLFRPMHKGSSVPWDNYEEVHFAPDGSCPARASARGTSAQRRSSTKEEHPFAAGSSLTQAESRHARVQAKLCDRIRKRVTRCRDRRGPAAQMPRSLSEYLNDPLYIGWCELNAPLWLVCRSRFSAVLRQAPSCS